MSDEAQKRTRASGEILDYLINEFELNPNPTPDQRKEFSERTGMSEKAVRIWFQNRRAKFRKLERQGKSARPGQSSSSRGQPSHALSNSNNNSLNSSRSNSLTSVPRSTPNLHTVPSEINEKYFFVDCSSLSVGTWQRVKTGVHENTSLLASLVNLSPYTLNKFMTHVDLMVIFSKKNAEINYFFSAMANNSKILFRIFYPLTSIVKSSLLDGSIEEDSIELRLNLASKPKFSVFFFNGVHANLNQWSICDDFSENQQVGSAIYAPGGTSTPHVLVGKKESLQLLQNYIQVSKDYPFNAPAINTAVDLNDPLLRENMLDSKDSMDERDFLHLVGTDSALTNNQAFSLDNGETWSNAGHNGPDLGMAPMPHLVASSQGGQFSPDTQGQLAERSSSFQAHKDENGFDDEFADSPNFFTVRLGDSTLQMQDHEHESSASGGTDNEREHSDAHTQNAHDALDSLHHVSGATSFGYDVDVDHSGFETNNLMVEGAGLPTHSPIPEESIGGHADNFIDYNVDA